MGHVKQQDLQCSRVEVHDNLAYLEDVVRLRRRARPAGVSVAVIEHAKNKRQRCSCQYLMSLQVYSTQQI